MIPCVETQHWFRPTIENVMLHQTQWAVSCVWVCDQSQSIDCTVEYVYILCYSGDCDVGVCMCVCVSERLCVCASSRAISQSQSLPLCSQGQWAVNTDSVDRFSWQWQCLLTPSQQAALCVSQLCDVIRTSRCLHHRPACPTEAAAFRCEEELHMAQHLSVSVLLAFINWTSVEKWGNRSPFTNPPPPPTHTPHLVLCIHHQPVIQNNWSQSETGIQTYNPPTTNKLHP